jgi:excinuclease UvrABC helicase subunit UvrB
MQLSSQQTAAIDFIKNSNKSLILSAVAGAGKTSTLLAMLEATEGSVAFCAFNKSIAKEIEFKVNQQNINKDVKVRLFIVLVLVQFVDHSVGLM